MKPTTSFDLAQLGGLSDLMRPVAPVNPALSHQPREIPLSDIVEDPRQPRREFDTETLGELADSIRLRGVKTPISVRPLPGGETGVDGGAKFMVNHGARRLRASRLARKATIPAWVDADYTEEDQIIENIHRDALTPREVAEFIGRKMAGGMMQMDIAKALGKSRTYVSQYAALLDLPEPVAEAWNTGRTQDLKLLNQLIVCHKEDPQATAEWLRRQEITRETLPTLRGYIQARQENAKGQRRGKTQRRHPDPDQAKPARALHRPTIHVRCEDGSRGELLFQRRPTREGFVWVAAEGKEREFRIEGLKFLALTEG